MIKFDFAELDEMIGQKDGNLLVIEVINLFTSNTPKELMLMSDSLISKDFKSLERRAHSMKSSCSHVGLLQLREEFSILENYLRNEKHYDENKIKSSISNIDLQLREALVLLDDYLLKITK